MAILNVSHDNRRRADKQSVIRHNPQTPSEPQDVLEFFFYAVDVTLFVVFEVTEAHILARSIVPTAPKWKG